MQVSLTVQQQHDLDGGKDALELKRRGRDESDTRCKLGCLACAAGTCNVSSDMRESTGTHHTAKTKPSTAPQTPRDSSR